MSIYTVISPYDLFWAGEQRKFETVKNGNIYLNLNCSDVGKRIERVISTDPRDYLKNDLLPGRLYKRKYTRKD